MMMRNRCSMDAKIERIRRYNHRRRQINRVGLPIMHFLHWFSILAMLVFLGNAASNLPGVLSEVVSQEQTSEAGQ